MNEYKIIFGIVASVFEIASNFPYIRDILLRKTKPHLFTWFIWTLLTGISFFILISEGAGVGAWITGVTSLACLTVLVLALSYGERNITKMDWICLVLAIIGLVVWRITDNAFFAIILILFVDTLGFMPTFRKSFYKPYEETLSAYVLVTIKHMLTLLALQAYTPATILYPTFLLMTNLAFVSMLITRRKKLTDI